MANAPQLLSGARGIIMRSNPTTGKLEVLAMATDISVNTRVATRQTFVCGRLNAAANDSLAYDVDVTIGTIIPVNPASKADGSALGADPAAWPKAWTPQTDTGLTAAPNAVTAIGRGIEQSINVVLTAGDLSVALYDRVTKKYASTVRNCRFAGRGFGMNAGDVATERYNFVGIYDSSYDDINTPEDIGYGV